MLCPKFRRDTWFHVTTTMNWIYFKVRRMRFAKEKTCTLVWCLCVLITHTLMLKLKGKEWKLKSLNRIQMASYGTIWYIYKGGEVNLVLLLFPFRIWLSMTWSNPMWDSWAQGRARAKVGLLSLQDRGLWGVGSTDLTPFTWPIVILSWFSFGFIFSLLIRFIIFV